MNILVITPTLGQSRWIDETIASVASQNPERMHILVAPRAAVAGLASRFPACRVVSEDPGGKGMYAAINTGLAAVGDWDAFTYLNDDDMLLPGFAASISAVSAAVREKLPLAVYGGVKLLDSKGRRLGAIPVSPVPSINRALYAQRLEPVYQHGTVFTRAAFLELGGFDETLRFCGDSEYLARACVRGVPFVRVPRAVAAFRLRAGQLTKNRAAMDAERTTVDGRHGLLARPARGLFAARLLFRLANLPVYSERVLRHGFVSFDTLLSRADR